MYMQRIVAFTMHVRVPLCMYTYVNYMCMCVFGYVCMCMCVCVYVCIRACVYVCMCVGRGYESSAQVKVVVLDPWLSVAGSAKCVRNITDP